MMDMRGARQQRAAGYICSLSVPGLGLSRRAYWDQSCDAIRDAAVLVLRGTNVTAGLQALNLITRICLVLGGQWDLSA